MTTDSITAPPARRGSSPALRFAIAFLIGVVLVVGVGGASLYAYGQHYTGRVLPGVTVGGTDLSGLAPEAASAVIVKAYGSLGTGRIVLTGPEGEAVIGYGEIRRRPDTETILASALAAGRQGEPVADLLGGPQTALRGVSVGPAVTYDPAKLEAAVAAVARTIDRPAVDATLRVETDRSYTITASVEGRTVDQAALLTSIDDVISGLDAPDELRLDVPLTTFTPATETADVEAASAAAERMAADLTVTHGDRTWTIPGKKLRGLISFQAAGDGSIVPIVDEGGIDALIKPIAEEVDQVAKTAGFRLSGNRVVATGASREGRKLDVAATHALVVNALMERQGGPVDAAIEAVVKTKQPAFTTAQARSIAGKMRALPHGRWKTYFHIYVRNGFGANIWVPAKLINGYVVGPGQTFDFWKAVGPVTRERGFKAGNAIINGRSDPLGAIGGGICTCSTTLFNAALRAGYKMGARKNHYYYIDRYPVGLDATVFISAGGSKQTMSWTNDTKYPVLIRGINTRSGSIGYVTFQLYSVPNGRKVVISAPTIKNRRQAHDSVQYTSALAPGRSVRAEIPVNGMDVWRTVTVYQGGKVMRKKTYYTHYATVTGVLMVGKVGAPNIPVPKA